MSAEIDVYILNEETILELSTKTDLTQKQLWDMYNHDQQFGLVSKIYLVPAKVDDQIISKAKKYDEEHRDDRYDGLG